MMKRGLLLFDHMEHEWRVWIGQQSYYIEQGYSLELRINQNYYYAYLEKDLDWIIRLDKDVQFVLYIHEVYKIRIQIQDYMPVDTPF
jgi:hypothetical protein